MAQNAKSKESTYESQKRRIEKLLEDPDKPVEIPDSSKHTKKQYEAPDFVRNVMGSSAGAGSGEFHVYRHLRRKEITRLKDMEESALVDELDTKFKRELDEMKRNAEERTKKRKLKRDKKKARLKEAKAKNKK